MKISCPKILCLSLLTIFQSQEVAANPPVDRTSQEFAAPRMNAQARSFAQCNASTPTINLEEAEPFPGASFRGPLHGVPRDNQDGLGTCYANVARNIMIGLSGGALSPSYMDMALQYKVSLSDEIGGLDQGMSCPTLEQAVARGVCDQNNSSLETGERNALAQALMPPEVPAERVQAEVMTSLNNFLSNRQNLSAGESELNTQLLARAPELIQRLQQNPNIKLPFPVIRHSIPGGDRLIKAASSYEGSRVGANGKPMGLVEIYNSAYEAFKPQMVRALIEGKSLEEIFTLYTTAMTPTLRELGLFDALENYRTDFLAAAAADFSDPNLRNQISDSVAFLRFATGRIEGSDLDFAEYCVSEFNEGLNFISSLQPLMRNLNAMGRPEVLIGPEGQSRSAAEMLQLVVAPACLNPANRRPVPFQINCGESNNTITQIKNSRRSQQAKIRAVRERVVSSLVEGIPLGNAFATGSGAHINTIAGMRFNPEANRCEYLIRETMTGESTWEPEADIFTDMESLTEARRR